MGKKWEVSLMLPEELWVLLGEGDSAGSLAATQLLLALWGRALKSEHGKTHFLCNFNLSASSESQTQTEGDQKS